MRRRLALLTLATTGLVVVALIVPLGILVRRQASDRARLDAERTGQATASLVALSLALGSSMADLGSALGSMDDGVVVALPDGSRIGDPRPGQGTLIPVAAEGRTVGESVPGGWEMGIPVIAREGTVVVDVFVGDGELRRGVGEAWLLLGLLAVLLIVLAVAVADRLGRRLVTPIGQLAAAARRLGRGDLEARVTPADPPELREVGEAFNWLAGRLGRLLAEEREAAADLSHRLRTPLTALRLQAERLSDPVERREVTAQVDRLEQAVDQVIRAARSEPEQGARRCDLRRVVESRCAFWSVLAAEQQRPMELDLGSGPIWVGLSEEGVEALLDALIGNVFAHTEGGVPFSVAVDRRGERAVLEVMDRGPGFPSAAAVDRGVSGAGSTGLGLDIVRRSAEMTGGALEMDDRPGGGAVVRVWLGVVD